MRKRNAIGCAAAVLFLLALIAGFMDQYLDRLPKGEGEIFVRTEGNVNAGMLEDVQKTAEVFNALLAEKMQATVSGDVQLFVTSEPEAYQTVLKREFRMKDKEAERVAKISGGWTSGRIRVTVLNGSAGVMNGSNDQVSTTGHELFHQVQYALSDGRDTDENALFWLEEGSADYVGAVVAESMGKQHLEKWERDRIYEMRSLRNAAKPASLQHCTLEQRKVLMEQKKHAYQMSDLMVIYLLRQQPEAERLPKLAAYFRALGSCGNGEQAFEKTFQIPMQDFLQGFDQWLQQMMRAPVDLRIVQREGVPSEVRSNLASDIDRAQEFLMGVWGSGLHGEYHFVLAASQQDFASAMCAELAMSEPEAFKTAEQSLWIENGSSVLLNAGRLTERRQQIFSASSMTARVLQGQIAGSSLNNLEWLSRGSAYLVAIHMLGKAQLGTMEQYKAAWLRSMRESSQGVPGLMELQTEKDWQRAEEKYGQDELTTLSELASLYLLEKHGWKSFYEWYVLTGKTGEAEKAFVKTYGKSSTDFAREFDMDLMKRLY